MGIYFARNVIEKNRRRMARKCESKDVSSASSHAPRAGRERHFFLYDTKSNAMTPGIADLSGGRGEERNIPRPTLMKTSQRFRSFGDRHTHWQDVQKFSDEPFDITYCNALLRMRNTPFGLTGKRAAPGESLPRRERVHHRTHGDINLYAKTGCLFKPSTSTANGRPKTTRRLKFPCFFFT